MHIAICKGGAYRDMDRKCKKYSNGDGTAEKSKIFSKAYRDMQGGGAYRDFVFHDRYARGVHIAICKGGAYRDMQGGCISRYGSKMQKVI